MKKTQTLHLTYTAIGVALIAALSQVVIPIGPVPFTLQTLAIGLIASLYKPREATLSVIFYLLLGAIGLPIFAGFSGGFSALFGPTSGFLWGFVLYAAITSTISKAHPTPTGNAIACFLGVLACFLIGSLVFKLVSGADWASTLAWTVSPFFLPEILKIITIISLVKALKPILKKEAYFS